jgi:hypothetical protein
LVPAFAFARVTGSESAGPPHETIFSFRAVVLKQFQCSFLWRTREILMIDFLMNLLYQQRISTYLSAMSKAGTSK